MQLPSVTSPVASSTYFQQEGRLLLNTKHKKPVILCSSRRFDCVCVCVCLSALVLSVMLPGEKTLELKRISKMMSLTEPTSLQAARTASVARESPTHYTNNLSSIKWQSSVCIDFIFWFLFS